MIVRFSWVEIRQPSYEAQIFSRRVAKFGILG